MEKQVLNLVITGHVDHGKSTLIGRILLDTHSLPQDKLKELEKISKELGKESQLAFLVDQLKEEREQERTIDTTQVFVKTSKHRFCLIDAPGHEEFIKNMLTGASHADAALLVVAVNEGLMEQTKRHAYLIHMLGIEDVVVVISKMDAIGYAEAGFHRVKKDVSAFLDKIGLRTVCHIPVSAKEGTNVSSGSRLMPWYRGPALLEAMAAIRTQADDTRKPLRFSVQDIYKDSGKDIIVGRVESGVIKKGDKITALPSGIKAKVMEIVEFGRHPKFKAQAGENPGLVLDNRPIIRGDLLILAGDPVKPSSCFKANIFWLSDKSLAKGKQMVLRYSTREVTASIESIEQSMDPSTLAVQENAESLDANRAAVVIMKTTAPVLVEKFSFIGPLGRFTMENNHVIQGIGIVSQPLV